MAHITTTKGPNLAPPKQEYDYQQQLQLLNQLRLYFNQIDGVNNQAKESLDMLVTLQWLGDN